MQNQPQLGFPNVADPQIARVMRRSRRAQPSNSKITNALRNWHSMRSLTLFSRTSPQSGMETGDSPCFVVASALRKCIAVMQHGHVLSLTPRACENSQYDRSTDRHPRLDQDHLNRSRAKWTRLQRLT